MALHDYQCDCGHVASDVYVSADDIMDHVQVCPDCGREMDYIWNARRSRFDPFTLKYREADGSIREYEMTSLHDVRRFEKSHQERGAHLELFNFDNFSGVDSIKGR